MLTALVLFALAAAPQFGPTPPVDPADFVSPSGALRLHVKPGDRRGEGAAEYSLWSGEELRWQVRLPLTLAEVALSDTGSAVGYGAHQPSGGARVFVVAAIDTEGKLMDEERTPFTMSRYMHSPSNPVALGLVPDFEHDRFFVRVRGEVHSRAQQIFWAYRASTGERLGSVEPQNPAAEGYKRVSLWGAKALPGTDLLLLHWWVTNFDDQVGGIRADGASFTLTRQDGSIAWQFDRPRDYTIYGDKAADDAFERELRANSPLLEVAPAGRFVLRFVSAGERVEFQAEELADKPGEWQVCELERQPFEAPEHASRERVLQPVNVQLEPLEPIALELESPGPKPPLQDARAWQPDDAGGFFAIRSIEEGDFVRVHIARDGSQLEEVVIDALPEDPNPGYVDWQALGDDEWLVMRTSYADPLDRQFAGVVEGRTGELFELTGLARIEVDGTPLAVKAGARLPDGRLVVLGSFRFGMASSAALVCLALDIEAEPDWVLGDDYRDETMLFSPGDVTVTAGGTVVVLDTVRDWLQMYAPDGEHLGNIDLEGVWGQEPSSTSDVTALPGGGVLVYDFLGSPPLWKMDLETGDVAQLTPHYSDGRSPDELARNVHVAPDGGLLTSDGYVLLRLDADGLVVGSLGSAAGAQQLSEPGAAAFLADGRICIQDVRTGAPFVWDQGGKLLFIGAVEPGDAEDVDSIGNFAVRPDGELWINGEEQGYLGWSATGERLGRRDFGQPEIAGEVALVPDSTNYWMWGYSGGASLRDAEGRELSRVESYGDGTWITAVSAVGFEPDGTVLIFESDRTEERGGCKLVRASAKGELLGALPLPGIGVFGRPSCAGSWVLYSRYGSALLDVSRPPAVGALISVANVGESCETFGLSPDGTVLLALDPSSLIVERYALAKRR